MATVKVEFSADDIKYLLKKKLLEALPEYTIKDITISVSAGHDDRFSYSPPSLNNFTVIMEKK